MEPLTIGSFCSGVGGLDMGAADALTAYLRRPVRHAWFCEYDKGASAVLAARFPDTANHGDLVKHDWTQAEPVDVLCMGVPCQPFSAAGKRKADDDHRYLWPYAVAAIRALPRLPQLIIFENVPNLVTIKGGDIWRTIQDDLMALGYRGVWRVAPAAMVGAPHLRKRVVLVAVLDPGREHMARSPVTYTKTGLPALPTPLARDGKGYSKRTLVDAVVNLLPTPRTTEAHGVGQRGLADGYSKGLDLRTAVALLKTPTAQLAVNGGSQHPDKRKAGGHGPTLADEVEHLLPTPAASPYGYSQGGAADRVGEKRYGLDGIEHLLPSPRASDGDKGGPNMRGSKGDLAMPSAVMLMPTPTVTNWHGNEANGRGEPLLPGAVREDAFGKYAPAIARWEAVTGRVAPPPREINAPLTKERLSPAFVEWMVGLPSAFVTGVALTRRDMLRCLGNIVVPQFATAITAELLAELGYPA